MVHPCIPDWDDGGNELHAANNRNSPRTKCLKKTISPGDVDQTEGAEFVCVDCYPRGKTAVGGLNLVPIG